MSLDLNLSGECSSAPSPACGTTAQSFGNRFTPDALFPDGFFDFKKFERARVQTPEGDWVEIIVDPLRPRGRAAAKPT